MAVATRHAVLTLWTDDPELAIRADAAGVDRIGPDLERHGKADRQAGLATWISPHTLEAVARVGAALRAAELFVRINPIHPGTDAEVEAVLSAGARVVMLPMFRTRAEVEFALALLADRARLVPLVETTEALALGAELAGLTPLEEVHIGINDLSLELGCENRFEVLLDRRLEAFCRAARSDGLRVGLGGVARLGARDLPLAPDLVYALIAGLGAEATLLARSFARGTDDLDVEVSRTRRRLAEWGGAEPAELERARALASDRIAALGQW
jgi:hypothetical protein